MGNTRGNDATPTWSGFNYQGKITLLVALIEINQLLEKKSSLDKCYIEIEKLEDFIVFIDNRAKSLNQVKAYLSKTKVSAFNEAMQKLLDHRAQTSELSAKCILCCPLDIEDWDTPTNIYKSNISLFKYNDQGNDVHIHVTEVAKFIKLELLKALDLLELDISHVDSLYLGLCELLHTKIAIMHKQEVSSRKYNLPFTEIRDFLVKSHTNFVVKEESRIREQIYVFISNNIQEIINDFCNTKCVENKSNVCKMDILGYCSLKTGYDYILDIDIWEYTKYLRPDVIDKWDNPLLYIDLLNSDAIRNLLIPIIYKISNDLLHVSSNSIYCYTNIYQTEQPKVIPTLLTFEGSRYDSEDDIKNSISNKLENIKKNSFLSSSIVAGSTITADTSEQNYSTLDDSILHFTHNSHSPPSINGKRNYVKIVDARDFIERIT